MAYHIEENGNDVNMLASVDRGLSISLIQRSKAGATGHPITVCDDPVEGTDSAGNQHRATEYIVLRWYIRNGNPKSYEEHFYIVDGMAFDAVLGASAIE